MFFYKEFLYINVVIFMNDKTPCVRVSVKSNFPLFFFGQSMTQKFSYTRIFGSYIFSMRGGRGREVF